MSANERDRQKCHKEYMDFRKAVPKVDITFLDGDARAERVCFTITKLNKFLERLLSKADAAAAEGVDLVCVADVETEYIIPGTMRRPMPYFWHKLKLRSEGVSENVLREREERQKKLDAEYTAIKSQKARQNRRVEFRALAKSSGMLRSDIYSIQIACMSDVDGDLVFAASLAAISENSFAGGMVEAPLLEKLFSHKAIIWANVGIQGDLTLISDSLFDGRLDALRFIDIKTLVEKALGEPLKKRPDVHGCGVLGIFQRVFLDEKLTWKKDPLLTRSHWWSRWSGPMAEYALNDVWSMAMVLRKISERLPLPWNDLTSPFPVVVSRSATPANIFGGRRMVSRATTAPFQYASSGDEDDSIMMSGPLDAVLEADEAKKSQLDLVESEWKRRDAEMDAKLHQAPLVPYDDEDWDAEPEDEATVGDSAIVADDSASTSSDSDDSSSVSSDTSDDTDGVDEDDVAMADDAAVDSAADADNHGDETSIDEGGEAADDEYIANMIDPEEVVISDTDNVVLEGPLPSAEGDGVALGVSPAVDPAAQAPTGDEWSDVEVVDEPGYSGRRAYDMDLVHKLVRMITRPKSKHLDCKRFSRSLPDNDGPEVAGLVVCMLPRKRDEIRKRYGALLSYFATMWSEAEKMRFFVAIRDTDPIFSHTAVAAKLRIATVDWLMLVCEDPAIAVDYFRGFPDRAPAWIEFVASLSQKYPDMRVVDFKRCSGFSARRAAAFMDASSDSKLKSLIHASCRAFSLELPVELRRRNLTKIIGQNAMRLEKGDIDMEMAVKQIRSSGMASGRDAVEVLLEPFPLLRSKVMEGWSSLAGVEFSAFDPCVGNSFHDAAVPVIKVLTVDMAARALRILQQDDELFVVVRDANDPRFPPDTTGVVGFSARRWEYVFALFPLSFPRPAEIVAGAVIDRGVLIRCINPKRVARRLGNMPRDRLTELGEKGSGLDDSAKMVKFCASKGVGYCAKYMNDIWVSPQAMRTQAMQHLAAEVRALMLP